MIIPKIKRGKIRCKYCNKIKSHVTTPCDCEKKTNWNNPNRERKLLRHKGISKTFIKMIKRKGQMPNRKVFKAV